MAEKGLADDPSNNNFRESVELLKSEMIGFEKRHGARESIEDAIVRKRRARYEDMLTDDCYNYDAWFDLARLEEAEGNIVNAREVYERAIVNSPPLLEKRFWRRYIYLWISYAAFEELQAKEPERAQDVYRSCLEVIPHTHFTFGKIWLMAAHLEVCNFTSNGIVTC